MSSEPAWVSSPCWTPSRRAARRVGLARTQTGHGAGNCTCLWSYGRLIEEAADGLRGDRRRCLALPTRVAAVCVWRDHALLQGALDGDFWVLPGGRVQPLEVTADALRRTMRWELEQEMTVQRLLWVMEYVAPMGGRPVHELGFYYATDLPQNSPFLDLTRDHAGVERGHHLVLRWFPVAAVPNLPLFPEFLRTAVGEMPDSPQHVVQIDIDPRPSD